MIKVGQIYKSGFIPSVKVISYIDDAFDEVSIIDSDGFVDRWKFDDIVNCKWELIAEYPTWQEAVNSKEFKTEEEEWTPLSELGCTGIDFDLISSNEFLECVKGQGFVDDDGDGYPVIKADDGTLLYNKKKYVYPSEIQNKDKLDFDYVAWFNR